MHLFTLCSKYIALLFVVIFLFLLLNNTCTKNDEIQILITIEHKIKDCTDS